MMYSLTRDHISIIVMFWYASIVMFSPEGQTGLLLHRVIKLMVDKRRGSNYEEVVMSSLIHRRSNSDGMV